MNSKTQPCYISMGSNRGESEKIIVSALQLISMHWKITGASGLYRTKPQIVTDQADFYNCAVRFEADADPREVLSVLQGIEHRHGRNRASELPKGPRSLDLDIIFFGSHALNDGYLTIPHSEYSRRIFVLVPLLDIDPELRDPVTAKPLSEYESALAGDPLQGIYPVESAHYNSFTSALRT